MSRGYGTFQFQCRAIGAHRVAWTLTYGEIPKGRCVLHRCDNRRCVRPDHLFVGTHLDNSIDMVRKGRSHRGEARPSAKLTENDVRTIRRLHRFDHATLEILTALYPVTHSTISKIVRRELWKHV